MLGKLNNFMYSTIKVIQHKLVYNTLPFFHYPITIGTVIENNRYQLNFHSLQIYRYIFQIRIKRNIRSIADLNFSTQNKMN